MSAPTTNAKSSSHLLRSRAKIAPVLAALAERHQGLTVELPNQEGVVRTQMLFADPAGNAIIVAASADETRNAALLALARVTLVAEPDDWHIEFVGVAPSAVSHQGAPAIRMNFPEILTVQQRRQDERYNVSSTLVLRCLADASGIAPFDAKIRDISLGGISVLLYPPDVMIEPGTVLLGSRIEIPGDDAVVVDLEVRYSELVTLEDGSRARCSGFRFVDASDEVKQKLVDAINNS